MVAAFSRLLMFIFFIATAALGTSCKGKESHGSGPQNGNQITYSNVYVAISAKSSASFVADLAVREAAEGQPCHYGVTQTIQGDGTCLTPKSVSLWATSVSLGNSQMTTGNKYETAADRILGGGSGFMKDGYFVGAAFDSTTLSALRGSDNLWNTYAKQKTYDQANINFAWINFVVDFKGSTWEYLVSFAEQPVSNYDWLEACYGKAWLDLATTRSITLSGMTFKTGDMMICKRTSASQPCKAAEFKWIDPNDGSLKDTRPSQPRQVSSASQLKRQCITPASNGAPPDAQFDLPALTAKLTASAKLYGDLSHGSTSQSNPAEKPVRFSEAEWKSRSNKTPFTVYFYEKDGQKLSGDKLDLALKLDFTNHIFLDGITDLATASEASVLKAITTKQFFAMDKLGIDKMGGVETGLKSDLDVKVSNTTNPDEVFTGPVAGAKAQPVSLR
ncbi:hypothetical protein EBU99_14045 [bacterium]|nr:hypothetical protein [bacterium]